MRWRLLISAGQGPIECRWLVVRLGERLKAVAEARGLTVGSISWRGEVEAPKSLGLSLVGDAPRLLAPELGTHALIDRSPLRGRAARKRWFVQVQLWAELSPAVGLDPRDVVYTTMKSGGAGGQHVNTTCSAVRAVHTPTGISVRVESERSQHQNRARALELLGRALAAELAAQGRNQDRAERAGHHTLERGRPVQTWRLDAQGRLWPEGAVTGAKGRRRWSPPPYTPRSD